MRTSPFESGGREGETPVHGARRFTITCLIARESRCLGMQRKSSGKRPKRLNTGGRPIAKKYSDGKLKSTSKEELKVPEIVKVETLGSTK